MSSGFQIEMRLVAMVDDDSKAPQSFMGVGGYQVSPETLRDPASLETARTRFHMVADELLNRTHMILTDNPDTIEEMRQEEVSADQLHHMSELVRAGKYVTKALMRTHDDGSKELTFTLTTDEESN